jgi:hypothetical protein
MALISLIFLSIVFVITLGIALSHYQRLEYKVAIYWGLAAWMSAGCGLAAWLLDRVDSRQPTNSPLAVVDRAIRPYLSVVGTKLDPLIVGKIPVMRVRIKNTGQTPATDVLIGSKLQIGGTGFFPDGGYVAESDRVTIGNGQTIETAVPDDSPLTPEHLDGIKSGVWELIAHGEVRYSSNPAPVTPIEPFRFCFTLERENLGNRLGGVPDPQRASIVSCDGRGFINRDKAIFR